MAQPRLPIPRLTCGVGGSFWGVSAVIYFFRCTTSFALSFLHFVGHACRSLVALVPARVVYVFLFLLSSGPRTPKPHLCSLPRPTGPPLPSWCCLRCPLCPARTKWMYGPCPFELPTALLSRLLPSTVLGGGHPPPKQWRPGDHFSAQSQAPGRIFF